MDDQKQEIPKAQDIEIKITLCMDGNFKVESPAMRDQMFMFGALEMAKLAVIQHNTVINQNRIQKPHISLLNRVRGKF